VDYRRLRLACATGPRSIVLGVIREPFGAATTVHVLGSRTRTFTPAFAAPARTDR
jgi:hypothetical protein